MKPQKKPSTANTAKTVNALDELVQHVRSNPAHIQSLVETLGGKSADRFKAAKQLQLISQAEPSLLYPHFDVFAKLLDGNSSVLLWNSSIILSHLVAVDTRRRFDSLFNVYYGHLWDGKLVTAANILASSGRIARCRPDMAERITAELLKVDIIPLPTAECREVARGHVLTAFAEYPDVTTNNRPARDFVVRCTASHRPSVRKRAEMLLDEMPRVNRQ